MTEAEWLACENPARMLTFVGRQPRERKFRLFGVACCRRVWEMFPSDACRNAVEIAEQYADGAATTKELTQVEKRLRRKVLDHKHRSGQRARSVAWRVTQNAYSPSIISLAMMELFGLSVAVAWGADARKKEGCRQSASLRDVFGNPFRPVAFDAAWRTSTAVALATQMYDSRDFGAMPILADALQDAGCTSDDILDHCRDPKQTHVRGCWVVDLVLGKE